MFHYPIAHEPSRAFEGYREQDISKVWGFESVYHMDNMETEEVPGIEVEASFGVVGRDVEVSKADSLPKFSFSFVLINCVYLLIYSVKEGGEQNNPPARTEKKKKQRKRGAPRVGRKASGGTAKRQRPGAAKEKFRGATSVEAGHGGERQDGGEGAEPVVAEPGSVVEDGASAGAGHGGHGQDLMDLEDPGQPRDDAEAELRQSTRECVAAVVDLSPTPRGVRPGSAAAMCKEAVVIPLELPT